MLLLRPHASGEADPGSRCSTGWVLIGLNQSWGGGHSHDGQYWCRFGAVIPFWLWWNQTHVQGLLRMVSWLLDTYGGGPLSCLETLLICNYDAGNYAATQWLERNKSEDKAWKTEEGKHLDAVDVMGPPRQPAPELLQLSTSFLWRQFISSNWVMLN